MPATRLGAPAKKYATVKEFQDRYSLSKTEAYNLVGMEEFREAIFKIGKKGIRVELNKAHEIMTQLFN